MAMACLVIWGWGCSWPELGSHLIRVSTWLGAYPHQLRWSSIYATYKSQHTTMELPNGYMSFSVRCNSVIYMSLRTYARKQSTNDEVIQKGDPSSSLRISNSYLHVKATFFWLENASERLD